MIDDLNRSNLTIVLFAVVAVFGVTVTAGGALATGTQGDVSAQTQATGTQSVSASGVASWGWWDDDDDEEEDSSDDSPWWEDDDPWWEDDDPWWEDDDSDDGDNGDGDSGDGDNGDGDSGDGDNGTDQPAPADFGVSVSGTNSPVTEGDTLTVDATVENTGGQEATQTVDFSVDGVSDSQSVTLGAGESQSVTFEWTTAAGDAGSYTATVESANDTATTSVSVEAPAPEPEPDPATFGVSVSGTNSPVTEGDTLTVDATVENTGGQQGTQTVELTIDGSTADSQSVTLAAGASQTVSLSWATAAGDAGDHTAAVSTANASAQTTVTVEAPAPDPDPATFGVSVSGTNSPVTEGDTLTVDATVENTGGQGATQTVSLTEGGTTLDSRAVTLAAGASQTVTLSWATGSGDAGSYDLTVASANASATASVTVEAPAAPANFAVSGLSSNSPVTAGGALSVTATVENTGGQQGTQTIELDVAGGVQDSQSVTLGAGDSQQVTLSWATAEGDAGSYTATVSSVDDSAQTDVTVESATTIPSSFTATLEDGHIQLGTGSSAYTINLTECPNGEPPSSDVNCQWAEATVDDDGTFSIAPEDLHFNTSVYVQQLATNVTVQMTAPNGLTGTTDWETGSSTLNGELDVVVPQFSDTCGAPVTISATTGTEDPLTGSTFNVSDGSPAEGTLVDSTYSVPAVTGCGTVAGFLDLNSIANSQLGLPSGSGNNRLVMDLHLEYEE